MDFVKTYFEKFISKFKKHLCICRKPMRPQRKVICFIYIDLYTKGPVYG